MMNNQESLTFAQAASPFDAGGNDIGFYHSQNFKEWQKRKEASRERQTQKDQLKQLIEEVLAENGQGLINL